MPTLKIHYDGWIALPAALRDDLAVKTGDPLHVEVIDGAIVLRPAGNSKKPPQKEAHGDELAPKMLRLIPERVVPPVEDPVGHAPRRRGRPRKIPQAPLPPEPLFPPVVGIGAPKLIKKHELEARAAEKEAECAAPALRPSNRPDRATPMVERKPFRNVEIRPVGIARGRRKLPDPAGGSRHPRSPA